MSDPEAALDRRVRTALLNAVLPHVPTRRLLLRALGAGTLLAGLESVFPLTACRALAQDSSAPEKKDLSIGFLPITCATALILASEQGYFTAEGLNVTLKRTPSWALVRDRLLTGEFDASQMLSPMPLALASGAGGAAPQPVRLAVVQNVNGSALTLHIKHKDKREPGQWKGFRFGIPFEHSIHNLLLRYYLAEHGVDPDREVELRVMAPPDAVSNLRAESIDGFLIAEPFGQRAVFEGIGFLHLLSSDLWDGHPCCTFVVTEAFVREHPGTFAALFRAMAKAAAYASDPAHRRDIVPVIAGANYLNQPVPVIEQVLTGRYADGLGAIREAPRRLDFDPFPYESMAIWILTQLKRWKYVPEDIDYRQIAAKVFDATDARRRLRQLGLPASDTALARTVVMGKDFDPQHPDAYLASFPIRRS